MEQVTYSKLNLKKNLRHVHKKAEKDLPTILYADIRTSGSKIHLSAEDPVPEGQKKDSNRCGYKSLSGVLILIIVLLCCALGYTGYMVYYRKQKLDELQKELCVNSSNNSSGCGLCPNHWSLHGDQCYYFSDTDRTWNQSRDHCKEMGADLLVIKDQEQQEFIQRFLSEQQTGDPYWVGLHRDGDVWRWVDGEQYNSSLFSIRKQSSGRCVYMTKSHYYQGDCKTNYRSICVKKAVRI